MDFFEKVSDYCEKNNISISAFEKMCGIGNGTIGRWRGGNSIPTLETLKKISEVTKIPLNEWIS